MNNISLQGNSTSRSSSASQSSKASQNQSGPRMTLEELRAVNRYAESTRSLSYLPQVSLNILMIPIIRKRLWNDRGLLNIFWINIWSFEYFQI